MVNSLQWGQHYVNINALNRTASSNSWFSFIYAKCRRENQIALWEGLASFGTNIHSPWLVGGDFNTIAHPEEMFGKHKTDERSIMNFNNFLMKVGLSDVGYKGSKFTWTNNRKGDENILERLDQFLVNGDFLAKYDLPIVTHLSRFALDHSSILCENSTNMKFKSRFHYMRVWESHPGFKAFIEENWQGSLHRHPLVNFSRKLSAKP